MSSNKLEHLIILSPIPATRNWFKTLNSSQRILLILFMSIYFSQFCLLILAAMVDSYYTLHVQLVYPRDTRFSGAAAIIRFHAGLWRHYYRAVTHDGTKISAKSSTTMRTFEELSVIGWNYCRNLSAYNSIVMSMTRTSLFLSLALMLCNCLTGILCRRMFIAIVVISGLFAIATLLFLIILTYSQARCMEWVEHPSSYSLGDYNIRGSVSANGFSFVLLVVFTLLHFPLSMIGGLLIFRYPQRL